MSALAEQHETWRVANQRLWRPLDHHRRSSARERMAELIARAEAEPPQEASLTLSAPTGPEVPEDPSGASKTVPVSPWRVIARQVCEKYDVTMSDLLSPRRDPKTVRARHEAIYRCRHETLMSLPQIGKRFKRDHTSALYAVARHEWRMRQEGLEFSTIVNIPRRTGRFAFA